jgi:hypothetical protein
MIRLSGEPLNTVSGLDYCNNPQYTGGIKTAYGEVYLDYCPSVHDDCFIINHQVFKGAVLSINEDTCEFEIVEEALNALKQEK